MKPTFLIENHTVHLWRALLTDFIPVENDYLQILNSDELQRAHRFRFPEHRQRFAIARGILRHILSQYISVSPSDIEFTYGPRGKPFLADNSQQLQFNVSHSENVAVYALTKEIEIGVDIQKVEDEFHDGVAKRFFSDSEYSELIQLPEKKRAAAFCRLWASKEALIKAVGEGLYVPLGHFSVSLQNQSQWIELTHKQHTEKFFLENINVYPNYRSAFATAQPIEKIMHWEWTLKGPVPWDYTTIERPNNSK